MPRVENGKADWSWLNNRIDILGQGQNHGAGPGLAGYLNFNGNSLDGSWGNYCSET